VLFDLNRVLGHPTAGELILDHRAQLGAGLAVRDTLDRLDRFPLGFSDAPGVGHDRPRRAGIWCIARRCLLGRQRDAPVAVDPAQQVVSEPHRLSFSGLFTEIVPFRRWLRLESVQSGSCLVKPTRRGEQRRTAIVQLAGLAQMFHERVDTLISPRERAEPVDHQPRELVCCRCELLSGSDHDRLQGAISLPRQTSCRTTS
jgi:hypothetical protein